MDGNTDKSRRNSTNNNFRQN